MRVVIQNTQGLSVWSFSAMRCVPSDGQRQRALNLVSQMSFLGEVPRRRVRESKYCSNSCVQSTNSCTSPRIRDASLRTLTRHRDAEVAVGTPRGDPSAAGALDQAALQQVRLVDVLHRVPGFAYGYRERPYPDRPALELVDDEPEVVAVGVVEAEVVHALHFERGVGGLLVYRAVADDLGVVANALEEPVGDPRRAAAAAGKLPGPRLGDRDPENLCVAHHNL